jgi:signal transduction histidine kinase
MTSSRTLVTSRPSAKDTWLILGSRYALTYPVFVLYIVPVVLSTVLLAQSAPQATPWTDWLVLGFVAWAAPVLVLIFVRATVLPNKPRASRPIATFVAFLLAGLVRAVLFSAIEVAMGVADNETPLLRLSGGTFVIAITFGMLSILVASRFEYRDEVRRLEADRKRLEELETGLALEVEAARSAVVTDAREVLAPIIDELKRALSKVHDSATATQVAEQMRDTVDAVVRPLSVQIAERPVARASENLSTAYTRHPPIRPEQRLGLSYFFLPFTFSLFIVSMTAASVLFVAGPTEGLRTIEIMFICLMAMLWLFRIATFRLRLGVTLGSLFFTAFHALAAWAITALVQYIGTSISRQLLNGWMILVAGVAYLSYRYQVVDHERRLIIASLAEVNERLEILLSSLRQQSKVDARRVANILHGPIQTALYASAMRMSQTETLAPETIGRILADLDSAMFKLLDSEPVAPALAEFVDELRSVWGAQITIELDAQEAPMRALEHNPVARSCAIEVVREGVNNAIKHGGASHISIEIFSVEPMLVDITVSNKTEQRQSAPAPGFGSSVLDDLTHDWRLTAEDGRTTLWASIALDNLSSPA